MAASQSSRVPATDDTSLRMYSREIMVKATRATSAKEARLAARMRDDAHRETRVGLSAIRKELKRRARRLESRAERLAERKQALDERRMLLDVRERLLELREERLCAAPRAESAGEGQDALPDDEPLSQDMFLPRPMVAGGGGCY